MPVQMLKKRNDIQLMKQAILKPFDLMVQIQKDLLLIAKVVGQIPYTYKSFIGDMLQTYILHIHCR